MALTTLPCATALACDGIMLLFNSVECQLSEKTIEKLKSPISGNYCVWVIEVLKRIHQGTRVESTMVQGYS
jgi:hypothetical protein